MIVAWDTRAPESSRLKARQRHVPWKKTVATRNKWTTIYLKRKGTSCDRTKAKVPVAMTWKAIRAKSSQLSSTQITSWWPCRRSLRWSGRATSHSSMLSTFTNKRFKHSRVILICWLYKITTFRKSWMSLCKLMRSFGVDLTVRVASSKWKKGTLTMRCNPLRM